VRRLLLDTATFLWVINDSPELSSQARESFVDSENEVYLSSVSAWEISIKYGLGRLPLPEPPDRFVPTQRKQHGIDSLQLDEEAALHLIRLPWLHKDPFDRMLVCQAIVHNLVILTADDLVTQYPVRTMW
jgi:PIN domain nuclease of toxin-antitoxin system